MFNRAGLTAISVALAIHVYGQNPVPSSAPTTSSPSTAAKSPASSPSPPPTTEQIINSLGEADLQAALSLLKANFASPDAITDAELNRATLTGLLVRMPGGLMLLTNREGATADNAGPFYSEIFEGHLGYLRFGDLNAANLKELDKRLQEFGQKKIDAAIIDLRASSTGDFASAAEFAKRFCPKGKPLFSVRKPGARQDRQFTSDRDPAFQGLIVVLVDSATAGGAEALAATLKLYDKALIIGQSTAGRAVEYSDQPLPSGKILRVASAEAVIPDGQPVFPAGVKPDLPVEMPETEKRQVFRQSAEKGMGPFVYETDRPHLNEAALMAGTNPELDIPDAQRRLRSRSGQPLRDPVLQRALDVVTSLEIYQKH
jgi:hypothetical protein